MNAKLKPRYKNGKGLGNLDIRLPGIAGRLSQMDARQLEQFVIKETEKRQEDAPSEMRYCYTNGYFLEKTINILIRITYICNEIIVM